MKKSSNTKKAGQLCFCSSGTTYIKSFDAEQYTEAKAVVDVCTAHARPNISCGLIYGEISGVFYGRTLEYVDTSFAEIIATYLSDAPIEAPGKKRKQPKKELNTAEPDDCKYFMFAEAFRAAADSTGMTMSKLCSVLNISTTSYKQWQAGRTIPEFQTVRSWSATFNNESWDNIKAAFAHHTIDRMKNKNVMCRLMTAIRLLCMNYPNEMKSCTEIEWELVEHVMPSRWGDTIRRQVETTFGISIDDVLEKKPNTVDIVLMAREAYNNMSETCK